MKVIKATFQHFLALSLRERTLAVMALIGVLFFAVDFAWARPHEVESRTLRQRLQQQDMQLAAMSDALRLLQAKSSVDPLAAQRAERDQLRALVAQAESVVGRATADTRLGDVIRPLATGASGLTLVSMKTLPMETIFKATPPATGAQAAAPAKAATVSSAGSAGTSQASASTAVPALYRHGTELMVRGGYLVLTSWMAGLERTAPGMFWGPARLDATTYPEATLKLTLFSLSVRPELPLE